MKNILVSNIGLPSNSIGSWVNRISLLITNDPSFFDFILSPIQVFDKQNVYCSKKKWVFYQSRLHRFQLLNWIARDYLKVIRKLLKETDDNLRIVVMDDLVLCEAIASLKEQFSERIELIYSFHGHFLMLPEKFGHAIDKVFFLTNLGYQESLRNNKIFSPEVFIVGNGVRSDKFFPLNNVQKLKLRQEFGFLEEDKIILWMANSRPAKGLHLFLKIINKLLSKNEGYKFLIIGNKERIRTSSSQVVQLGRINHEILPKYLQLSDYYFFTSLWKEGFGLSLVEAIKCGLTVISSANGGITEVVEGCHDVALVIEPNKTDEWVKAFDKVKSREKPSVDFTYLSGFHSYDDWEKKFKEAILA